MGHSLMTLGRLRKLRDEDIYQPVAARTLHGGSFDDSVMINDGKTAQALGQLVRVLLAGTPAREAEEKQSRRSKKGAVTAAGK